MSLEHEQVILLQRKFIRLQGLALCLIILFSSVKFVETAQLVYVLVSVLLIAGFAMEIAIFRLKPIRLKWLSIIKYCYFCITVILIAIADSKILIGVGLLSLVIFEAELFLVIDFTDIYVRRMLLLTLAIPSIATIGIVAKISIIRDFMIFFYLVIMAFDIIMVCFFGDIFAKIIEENEEKVFAQTRLIERINETNEELRIHQEKVKSTNELLGVQNIELQSAYIKINDVNEEMCIQNEILKYISASLDIDKLMGFISESFVKRIGMDVSAIVLKQGTVGNKKIVYRIETVLSDEFKECLESAIKNNCFEQLVSGEQVYCDNHIQDGKYSFLVKGSVRSMLIMPLTRQQQQMGVLFIGHRKLDYFNDNMNFFEGIVSQFLIGLNNANLYQEMQTMAILDGLTGIYNRRHLTKLFNQYMYESINNRAPLSAALFDIDFFKKINDTYGHLFGDEIIKTIANLARTIAEEYDGIAARYGGEEFVIIFPNKGLEEAYPAVEKLHREVKKLGIMHHGKKVTVNVSVGFTSFPSTCRDPRELLNRADWSMYYSKQHGRDQITIDSDEIQKEVSLE